MSFSVFNTTTTTSPVIQIPNNTINISTTDTIEWNQFVISPITSNTIVVNADPGYSGPNPLSLGDAFTLWQHLFGNNILSATSLYLPTTISIVNNTGGSVNIQNSVNGGLTISHYLHKDTTPSSAQGNQFGFPITIYMQTKNILNWADGFFTLENNSVAELKLLFTSATNISATALVTAVIIPF